MNRHRRDETDERVRIPADVDREDRLLGNLTARQLAILTVAALGLWVGWAATRRLLPLPVFAALAAPFAGLAVTLAIGRWHGLPADRLLAAVIRQQLTPRRLIPAPDGIPTPTAAPTVLGAEAGMRLGVLGLPVLAVADDGTLELEDGSRALLASVSAVSFALRTPAEREALVAGFGRYLNSLSAPIQILLTAEPVDLRPIVKELDSAAPGLPHARLEAACQAHADYLAEFAANGPLLRRDVLLVLRTTPAQAAPTGRRSRRDPQATKAAAVQGDSAAVQRLAADAAAALAVAGVTLAILDGPATAARLGRSLRPAGPPPPDGLALPDDVITGAGP